MADPILWTNAAERTRSRQAREYNPASGQWEPRFDEETGLPIREKIPQVGHVDNGETDDPTVDRRIRRYVPMLRHDGHVVNVVLNMGAADAEGAEIYGKSRMAKARHLGWIHVGRCPLAMVLSHELRPQQICSEELLEPRVDGQVRQAKMPEHACGAASYAKPCPHYFKEEAARKERQRKQQAKVDAARQSEADKLIKAQQAQTSDIVKGVGAALADAIKAVAQPRAPEPEPAPVDPKERRR